MKLMNDSLPIELFESKLTLLIEHQWQINKNLVYANNIVYTLYSFIMII
jgi:hypothetical protein